MHTRRRCDDCNEEFNGEWELIDHFDESPEHDYCRFCNEHFECTGDLDEHIDEKHAYCEECDRVRLYEFTFIP